MTSIFDDDDDVGRSKGVNICISINAL